MTRAARIEGRVQIAIMLFMGGVAGAASFKHLHDLAVTYGQPSLIGWADAVVVELMSIVAGLEIRRRKRAKPKQSTGFVYVVFFGAVLISLAAQVAKAHPSPWGWIMAALPALGFLAVVKIVLTRQPIDTEPDRSETDNAGPVQISVPTPDLDTQTLTAPNLFRTGPDRTAAGRDTGPVGTADRTNALTMRTQPAIPIEQADSRRTEQQETATANEPNRTDERALDRAVDVSLVPTQRGNDQATDIPDGEPVDHDQPQPQLEPHQTHSGPVRDRSASDVSGPVHDQLTADAYRPPRSQADYELLELGKTIATKLAMRRKPLTRQALIDGIREDGRTIGTDRASHLLRWIKENEAAPVGSG